MELKTRTHCPLCRSGKITLFRKGTFDPQSVSTEDFKITDSNYGSLWTFYTCKDCGFVFSNPYIPADAIVAFYEQLEDREYSMEAEGRTKNFQTLLKRIRRVRQFLPDTDKPACLLDIGAAGGIFMDQARKEGYDVEGIEPSEFLVKDARKHYGLSLFKGTVEEFLTEKKYPIITLLDIVEHLVDADAFMGKVDTLMAENGLLVIVTPDVSSLAARLTGKRWWHYRIAHINFFNLRSLRTLLEKYGYDIVLKKKYVWNFSIYYLLTRVFPFFKGKKTLQKALKRVHLKLPLRDSWEIYARKRKRNTEQD